MNSNQMGNKVVWNRRFQTTPSKMFPTMIRRAQRVAQDRAMKQAPNLSPNLVNRDQIPKVYISLTLILGQNSTC